ncbi:hypothetical protein MRB56_08830 [Halomonas cupida]|uniref:hypothetical protein n=1 Tax=Halomonas cupida TaxID=44933 RepID=UPI0039B50BC7
MKKHALGIASFVMAAASPGIWASEEAAHDEDIASEAPFLTMTAQNLKLADSPIHPFINSALPDPPQDVYSGPLFQLRHDYPEDPPSTPTLPWKEVTNNGRITTENSLEYVDALKQYVSDDMRQLLYNYEQWNPSEEPWWESIWLGSEREPIHGFYVGSGFPAGTLPEQDLDFTTYVLTLYDETAAATLGNIWGTTLESAHNPNLNTADAQYAEGSVIVKFAFVTTCGADWAPMDGTVSWPIYSTLNESNGSGNNPQASNCPNNGSEGSPTDPALTNVYLMQFDIIVKDSQAAPETGWVFSTLVYDKSAQGDDAWDKMIPLGATWGNDPNIVNTSSSALTPPVTVNTDLEQNWINPESPAYATATLGWDGRLSGPNDGAVVTPAWAGSHYYPEGLASAGCLGCHSSAQYQQKSFLLPSTTYPPRTSNAPGSGAKALVLNEPGSEAWMKWFQSRPGTDAMDPGAEQVGLDYDMVTSFKAIPMWQAAMENMQKDDAENASLERVTN